ncbi:MAG: MgtC/SapB family protein [Gemmatimonadaceae bacterium]|nr:MgtC/SapB family protein [Gemmatimonadaceae bacterium]
MEPLPQGTFMDTVEFVTRANLGMKLLVAIVAGGAIGFERQLSGKPAGLRTNILICVGSALLMDISIRIGGVWGGAMVGDPARLAAQVVTGIGFLGAGTIMQGSGVITGLTTAATIWTVAAIGLAVGAGYVFDALLATLMVMLVLAGLGGIEHKLLRAQRVASVTIRTRPEVTLEWLQAQLAMEGLRVLESRVFDHARDRVFELRLRGPSRQFDIAKAELATHARVSNVFFD